MRSKKEPKRILVGMGTIKMLCEDLTRGLDGDRDLEEVVEQVRNDLNLILPRPTRYEKRREIVR